MLWKTPLNCTSKILDSLNHMPGTMPQKSPILEQNTSLYILYCTIMLGCLLHCGCHWPVWKRIFIFLKTPAFHSFSMTQSFWKTLTSESTYDHWSLIFGSWSLVAFTRVMWSKSCTCSFATSLCVTEQVFRLDIVDTILDTVVDTVVDTIVDTVVDTIVDTSLCITEQVLLVDIVPSHLRKRFELGKRVLT